MIRKFALAVCLACVSQAASIAQVFAAAPPTFVGLGDSIGEGVQSADSNARTQPNTYLNLVARQMGVPFPLPLIKSSPFGAVGETFNRSRMDPNLLTANLSVSGASTGSILNDMSGTPIDDEVDLVLSPQIGSQITIAQSLRPPFTICWIGANDALGSVLSFNQLNGTQFTSQAQFQSNFQQIVTGLTGWGGKIIFANVPDVTKVGFMLSRQDLITFLGNDYGLADGSYTSAIAMLLIKLGINNGSLIQNPDWVLDPTEIQNIQNAVIGFNQTMATQTAAAGVPLLDAYTLFNDIVAVPPTFGNVTVTNRFLGGIFSLDGVHPSDIGHALVANFFIGEANSFYHMNIPPMSQAELDSIVKADPFIDFNGDLVVHGRPFAGLLETLGPFLGISGDAGDVKVHRGVDKSLGPKFMRAYFQAMGKDPNTPWNENDAIHALAQVFALDRYVK